MRRKALSGVVCLCLSLVSAACAGCYRIFCFTWWRRDGGRYWGGRIEPQNVELRNVECRRGGYLGRIQKSESRIQETEALLRRVDSLRGFPLRFNFGGLAVSGGDQQVLKRRQGGYFKGQPAGQ